MSNTHDCCDHSEKGNPPEQNKTLNQDLLKENLIETVFNVSGMDCADEVTAIQGALRDNRIAQVNANLMSGTVRILHLPSIGSSILKGKVESAGVKVKEDQDLESHSLSKSRILLVLFSGIFTGLGLINDFYFKKDGISLAIYILAVTSGGFLVFPKALRSIRQFRLDINVLMTIAVLGAFGIREYSEGATVVFLFALSELLESFSVAKARRAIRDVIDLAPKTAIVVLLDGSHKEIAIADLKIGNVILVKSGGKIPVDGLVRKGASLVNQAPLTGESVPVNKNVGDQVFAGTVNESGALEIEVKKLFEDSKAASIIRIIEEAQKEKAPSQRFVDTFARYYTPIIFLVALVVFLGPPIFFQGEWSVWLYRALVLLVIACPCALVISTPVSVVSGLAAMARRGVLVKGGVFLETLGKIRALAVDKTGTITYGKPKVQAVHALNGAKEQEIVSIAASLEALSAHPLAHAVIEYSKEKNISSKVAEEFKTVVGYGVEAKINGHQNFLGNHRFAHESGVCTPELENLLSSFEEKALSVIVVGHKPHENCQGEALGVITVGDKIRSNAKSAIQKLRDIGVKQIVMLSGDNLKTAQTIASQVSITEVRGDLLPEDKSKEINNLVSKYGVVAMVGDGINDAPALAASSLGIAMGVTGTDTALETADVALMKDDIAEIATAIEQGRRVLTTIKTNIGIALTVKMIFLALALFGRANLWVAVLADTGTSLLVVLNALRLLRVNK